MVKKYKEARCNGIAVLLAVSSLGLVSACSFSVPVSEAELADAGIQVVGDGAQSGADAQSQSTDVPNPLRQIDELTFCFRNYSYLDLDTPTSHTWNVPMAIAYFEFAIEVPNRADSNSLNYYQLKVTSDRGSTQTLLNNATCYKFGQLTENIRVQLVNHVAPRSSTLALGELLQDLRSLMNRNESWDQKIRNIKIGQIQVSFSYSSALSTKVTEERSVCVVSRSSNPTMAEIRSTSIRYNSVEILTLPIPPFNNRGQPVSAQALNSEAGTYAILVPISCRGQSGRHYDWNNPSSLERLAFRSLTNQIHESAK